VATAPAAKRAPPITFGGLKRFLRCPANGALLRHLRLTDDEDTEPEDDEPFTTDALTRSRLTREALDGFVARAVRQGVEHAAAGWPSGRGEVFEKWRVRGRLPEGGFGELDQSALAAALGHRITAPTTGLAEYLKERSAGALAGPVLVGEGLAPVHAR